MHRSAFRTAVATALAATAVLTTAVVGAAGPANAGPRLVPYATQSNPATIPDAAMLQPRDLDGAALVPVTSDYWDRLRPPQPCTDRPYPSSALETADRAGQTMIGVGALPTVVVEHVAVYRLGAAHLYLRDLRRALAACPAPGAQEPRWTVRGTGVAGDESILLELREYLDYAEVYKSTYVVVARTGRALVVVADAGWETGNGHPALVRDLAPLAVARAPAPNRS